MRIERRAIGDEVADRREGGPAVVVVAGAFSNAWQTGKMGDAGGQPQPAELALMTPSGDLWLHALGDAGNSLQPSPLAALADICHAQATARLGWALGASATDEGDGYRLPPDPRSADPVQSQIRAHVQLSLLATPAQPARVLSRQTAQLLPLQYAYAGPRVHAFVPRALDGREFGAWLDPGTTREAALGDGLVAVRWLPPAPGFVDRIQARSPAGVRIGLLALGGITRSAAAAADQRNAATAAEAVKQDNATRAGPPDANAVPAADRRCVLEPGRLYRIDVRMRWSGTLWRMDDQNKKQVVASKAAGDDTESTRQFWFRTAPLQPAGGAGPGGGKAYFSFLHRRQDLFDPAMLERHLLGYEPAQSELQRFAHDPVKVRFSPGHVALLAGAYKFDLLCALRRLDQPEAVEADQFLVPSLAWATSTAQMHVSDAVIAQAYIASACGLAPNAVDLLAKPMLTRDTWYEVFVLAKSQREGVMDGRLPGVSFRTSRWANGEEMMQGLHFPISGAGHADGGIALPPDTMLKPQVSEGDDGAFDAFLISLGLEGWPAASEPRASLVWLPPIAPNLSWRCAGLMLESPEAIHRPMRFEVIELQLVMGAAKIDFNVRWRDRSGSRLLIAASLPFVPRLTRRGGLKPLKPMLRLRCNDMPLDGAARVLQGLLELPLQPSFAEEAQ